MNPKEVARLAVTVFVDLLLAAVCLGAARPSPSETERNVRLSGRTHPYLACTIAERRRLQQAYRGQGPEHRVVAAYVDNAEAFLDEPLVFPPRGGQHNQWYQCDHCETALRTLDPTHHQCPKCQKVYTGHPYDDVIFSRQHSRNLGRMETAAWAYVISGRREFADYAAGVLLGYAKRYRQYPYHSASLETKSSWGRKAGGHLYEQTLTEASALATRIGPAYDLIHDSGALSQAQHEQVRAGLLLPMLENIGRNRAGKSNWQTWHNAAMLWGGALVQDPTWVTRAIADERNGFHYQMDVSVSKEGMWYENSWGYHFYTLRALVIMAETARRLDLNLWGHERLETMFTLGMYYTMADGSLPRFGDDVHSSVRGVSSLFEPAYQAYKDRRMLAVLRDRPGFQSVLLGRSPGTQASLPVLKSVVFEAAGHAILRSDGEAGLTAAMTFGPYGGFHGHYDKLSFVLFGFGRELGVDPGRARSQAYRLPIHRDWYKATISHNTVLVDGKSQQPATGKLDFFEHHDDYAAVAARCDQACPGVSHQRLLVMTGQYLLVLDELSSDKDRRFDWLYHNRGTHVLCDAATDSIDPGDEFAGAQYVRQAKRGRTGEMVEVVFGGPDVSTRLLMAGEAATVVTVGDGVGASVDDRVPLVMVTRRGQNVHFAAVLEPLRAGQQPSVEAVRLTESGQGRQVEIVRDGRTDRIRVSTDGGLAVNRAR